MAERKPQLYRLRGDEDSHNPTLKPENPLGKIDAVLKLYAQFIATHELLDVPKLTKRNYRKLEAAYPPLSGSSPIHFPLLLEQVLMLLDIPDDLETKATYVVIDTMARSFAERDFGNLSTPTLREAQTHRLDHLKNSYVAILQTQNAIYKTSRHALDHETSQQEIEEKPVA